MSALSAPSTSGRAITARNGGGNRTAGVLERAGAAAEPAARPSHLKKTGMIRMARMLTTLIIGFTAGPEVSL